MPEGERVSDFRAFIEPPVKGHGVHISVNSPDGLTVNMEGFGELFSHWEAGHIHFHLRYHIISLSIPEMVETIQKGGEESAEMKIIFDYWRWGMLKRTWQSAAQSNLDHLESEILRRSLSNILRATNRAL